jgi:hypothetical protein
MNIITSLIIIIITPACHDAMPTHRSHTTQDTPFHAICHSRLFTSPRRHHHFTFANTEHNITTQHL